MTPPKTNENFDWNLRDFDPTLLRLIPDAMFEDLWGG